MSSVLIKHKVHFISIFTVMGEISKKHTTKIFSDKKSSDAII